MMVLALCLSFLFGLYFKFIIIICLYKTEKILKMKFKKSILGRWY